MTKFFTLIGVLASLTAHSAAIDSSLKHPTAATMIAAPESLSQPELITLPQNPSKIAQNTPSADTRWEDWYEYDNGTFSSENTMFISEKNVPITVYRRDDMDGGQWSQLCFKGLFNGIDFIVNFNNEDNTISWDEIVLPFYDEKSDFDNKVVHLLARSNIKWSTKEPVSLGFFYLINPYQGWNGGNAIYRSHNVITDWDFSIKFEGIENRAKQAYNTTTAKCTVTYRPDERVERTQFKWVQPTQTVNYDDIDVYDPYLPVLEAGQRELTFTKGGGIYRLLYVFFDKENDVIGRGYVSVYSNIFYDWEWEEVGVGMFESILLSQFCDSFEGNLTFTPDVTQYDPYPVKIIRNKIYHDIYRIVNPYGTGTPYENISIITGSFSGIYADYGYGDFEIELSHDQDYYIEFDIHSINNYTNQITGITRALPRGIYFQNSGGFAPSSYLAFSADGIVKLNEEGIITFPGAKVGNTILEANPSPTFKDNKEMFLSDSYDVANTLNFTLTIPLDASKVFVAAVCKADYDPATTPQNILNGNIKNIQTFTNPGYPATLNVSLPAPAPTNGRSEPANSYTIVAVTTSYSNKILSTKTLDLQHSGQTRDLRSIGTVTFNDPVSVNDFSAQENEIRAEILEDYNNPGFFVIKAPWIQSFYLFNYCHFASSSPRDLVIDATDPEHPFIHYGCLGYTDYNHGNNMLYVSDLATYFIFNGRDKNDIQDEDWGIYTKSEEAETIFMPSINTVCLSPLNNNSLYLLYNYINPTTFTINRNVNSIPITYEDNSALTPQYFNLQGQQVENPSSGLYIVRRGKHITKEYIR